jgi:threonine/homoserine/homoserine lactone efflux protein
LLALATLMSFTPGPNTTLSAALAANHGLPAALRFIVAVPVGWTLMMLASGMGIGVLILALPGLRWSIQALGVAYLVWLAWRLAGTRALGAGGGAAAAIGFWQGVCLQFVNIKAWMLALALAAGWVANAAGQPSVNPQQRLFIVCAVMAAFALGSNLAYALVGNALRRRLAVGDRLLWFNRGMALMLLATAAWMLRA